MKIETKPISGREHVLTVSDSELTIIEAALDRISNDGLGDRYDLWFQVYNMRSNLEIDAYELSETA